MNGSFVLSENLVGDTSQFYVFAPFGSCLFIEPFIPFAPRFMSLGFLYIRLDYDFYLTPFRINDINFTPGLFNI